MKMHDGGYNESDITTSGSGDHTKGRFLTYPESGLHYKEPHQWHAAPARDTHFVSELLEGIRYSVAAYRIRPRAGFPSGAAAVTEAPPLLQGPRRRRL